MTIQDPISDMFIKIKNALSVKKKKVEISFSNIAFSIIKLLTKEGYLQNYIKKEYKKNIYKIIIDLKYYRNKPVINVLKRISKPSVRIYKKNKNLKTTSVYLGMYIVSTSKGIMSNYQAYNMHLGGEVIGIVQ